MTESEPSALVEAGHPGETLRRVRQERGFGLDEVANQLNLTTERVSQIEAEQWERLPGATFARGYLRLYARLLELDADSLVEQFNQAVGSLPLQETPLNMPYSAEAPRLPAFLNLRLLSLFLLVVLIVIGFVWWKESRQVAHQDEGLPQALILPETLAVPDVTQMSDNTVVLSAEQAQDRATEEPTASINAEAVTDEYQAAAPASSLPNSPVVPEAVEATPTQPLLEQQAAEQPATDKGLLRLDFSGECWVQVTDATGKVLFSGIQVASSVVDLSGTPPIAVILGNARVVKVQYNNEPVLVEPLPNGVARFSLTGHE